jgi:hypothetical protein
MFSRKIFDFSVQKGLAGLMAFTAPAVKNLLNKNVLNDDTARYPRKTGWSTVEYR